MGKKRMAIVGEMISEGDKDKQERIKRQKEGAKIQKTAEKKTAHAPGQKGGERVVDLTEQILEEAARVEQKTKDVEAATTTGKPEDEVGKRMKRGSFGRSKIYKAAKSKVDPLKQYPLEEALRLLKEVSYAKLNGTVELHLNLREKAEAVNVELPFATGKTRRVAVADEATLEKIEKGQIDFDVLLASADQMPKIVKFAKVLGPRGLMPNPKNGTVVANPKATAERMAKTTTVLIKGEKGAPVVHTTVGKLSQKDEELTANIKSIMAAFGMKLTKVTLKSTMSPAIKLLI